MHACGSLLGLIPMTRLAFVGLLAGALGCERGVPPAYVRLTGAAPPFTAPTPSTRATLLVFWASWCAPCVAETPSLVALAEAPPADLSVVVFDREESMGDVVRYFKGAPPSSLNLRLDEGNATGEVFGVQALPVSQLVVDGQRVARFSGPQDWDGKPMRALLARLVNP